MLSELYCLVVMTVQLCMLSQCMAVFIAAAANVFSCYRSNMMHLIAKTNRWSHLSGCVCCRCSPVATVLLAELKTQDAVCANLNKSTDHSALLRCGSTSFSIARADLLLTIRLSAGTPVGCSWNIVEAWRSSGLQHMQH